MFLSHDEAEALRLFLRGSAGLEDPLYRAIAKLLAEQPATGDGEVEFSARVPEELYNQFKQRYPIYGSVKWFITSALTAFIQQVEGQPELDHQIRLAIDDMLRRRAAA